MTETRLKKIEELLEYATPSAAIVINELIMEVKRLQYVVDMSKGDLIEISRLTAALFNVVKAYDLLGKHKDSTFSDMVDSINEARVALRRK